MNLQLSVGSGSLGDCPFFLVVLSLVYNDGLGDSYERMDLFLVLVLIQAQSSELKVNKELH